MTPSQEMIDEGVLRDVVNKIQRLRKEYKLVPTDEIVVYYQVTPAESKLSELLKRSTEFIETNTKKPFQLYEENLKLNVKNKTFEVILENFIII
jgi:isoleucyl-tRNA synthetase